VRFAPSPTGFLHVGSARTFIFNWLYARHNGGTMILRLDDTDVERNTQASVDSIFEGLKWLNLGWDEEYKQSERIELHRKMAWTIFEKGLAYRDFTPAHTGDAEKSGAQGTWLFNAGARELSHEESARRAAAGEPFALRFRVPREAGQQVRFGDAVYGEQVKLAADIEDFALLRSDGMPTYHLASCADDADLRISHIIRGQDHLSNTFKHVLIFEAAGSAPPQFAHLPLLVAPDGTKLSKRRHGPVVSVTTYRDAGFLPEAFINFLCLLGWSPKNDRENMSLQELTDAFSLEGINRSNAVVNFKEPAVTPEEAFDPKAVWLNAEHIRGLPVEELRDRLLPIVRAAGFDVAPEKMLRITPLIRERIKLLRDVLTAADFFFVDQLPPYDPAELIPQKGDEAMAKRALDEAEKVLPGAEFKHDPLDQTLRNAAQGLGVKPGQMFQPIRVAVCGRKNAPPLFETLEVLGPGATLARIEGARWKLMNDSEMIAYSYLVGKGFQTIRFEPHGKRTPDFLVNDRVAIEVRRLNQHHSHEGISRGLEEVSIPLQMRLRQLFLSFGPPNRGHSWFVNYRFKRPLPRTNRLIADLRNALQAFEDNLDAPTSGPITLDRNFEVDLFRASDKHSALFLLGASIDSDTGGWVRPELERNLRIAVQQKAKVVARYHGEYPEWWLILVDRVSHGAWDGSEDFNRALSDIDHTFSKIILVDESDPPRSLELV
jgi:glutamyl-tRNA synthetase